MESEKEVQDKKPEKKKLVVWTSRRSYLLIYFLIVMMLLFLVVVRSKEIPISPGIFWGIILACIFMVKVTEINRFRKNCEINKRSVIVNIGIFNVNSKRVDYVAISEVSVNQTLIQRLLNIGNVKIMVFSNEKTHFVISNVYNPRKIADIVEKNMMDAKRGNE